MQTVWQLMKDDLKGLLDSAQENQGDIPGPIMNERNVNGMIESWNALGKMGEFHFAIFRGIYSGDFTTLLSD